MARGNNWEKKGKKGEGRKRGGVRAKNTKYLTTRILTSMQITKI